MSRPSDPLDLSHLPAWADTVDEGERWRSSINDVINTLHSMRCSPGTPTDLSVRMLVIANALERGMDEIELYLGEAEKALQRLPEVSARGFKQPPNTKPNAPQTLSECYGWWPEDTRWYKLLKHFARVLRGEGKA